MSDAGQRWVSTDYRLTPDGTVVHKRWLNADGSRKSGVELKKEILRVDLERISERLLEIDSDLSTIPIPTEARCGFCGLLESDGGGKIHDIAGHLQTFCCGVVVSACCEGTENGR
jgi:hypothetical protein